MKFRIYCYSLAHFVTRMPSIHNESWFHNAIMCKHFQCSIFSTSVHCMICISITMKCQNTMFSLHTGSNIQFLHTNKRNPNTLIVNLLGPKSKLRDCFILFMSTFPCWTYVNVPKSIAIVRRNVRTPTLTLAYWSKSSNLVMIPLMKIPPVFFHHLPV